MRNTWGLPIVGLIAAAILAIIVMGSHGFNSDHLSEMELGAVAGALCFFIYGIQGVVSVLIDGEELKPGKRAPHITGPLTIAIVVVSVLLLIVAVALAYTLTSDYGVGTIGLLAGAGCFLLAGLLVGYKEALIGEEGRFDRRDDGVPW
jgi:amino acid transporter